MSHNYDDQNIFARIIRGEIPCNKVFEDDTVIAFHDIAPAAPVHVLVLPKGSYISFDDFTQRATSQEVASFFQKLQAIAESLGVVKTGYRIIMNHGSHASQAVPHFHAHVLGGRNLGGLVPHDHLVR